MCYSKYEDVYSRAFRTCILHTRARACVKCVCVCVCVCVCMCVDMYVHISYFICGKLTFDYTKWPQYEADQLPSSGAKAMNG